MGIVKSNVLANTLFAASEEGILRSVDFGATWAPYNNALPTTHLTSLLIGPFSDTMFVSTTTHGVLKVWNYLTGVTETHMLPGKIGLLQNYPNPFNPSTKIQFTIPEGTYGRTSLRVYDLLGREVATLVNEEMRPGTYERTLDAAGLASGIYFYRLQSGGFVETKKLAVVR